MYYRVETNDEVFITNAGIVTLHKWAIAYCKAKIAHGATLSGCKFAYTPVRFIAAQNTKFIDMERTAPPITAEQAESATMSMPILEVEKVDLRLDGTTFLDDDPVELENASEPDQNSGTDGGQVLGMKPDCITTYGRRS